MVLTRLISQPFHDDHQLGNKRQALIRLLCTFGVLEYLGEGTQSVPLSKRIIVLLSAKQCKAKIGIDVCRDIRQEI